jgi:hypothetical protein
VPTSPDALNGLLALVDRYGLPLLMLIGVGFLLWRGVLRLGPDVDRQLKQAADQTAYVEARRVEEREGRLKAEARIEANAEVLREATDGFREANSIMKALMERVT